MARPRTPTRTLEARGAFRKDPSRRRKDPEVSRAFGSAPEWFNDDQRIAWDYLVMCLPDGILTGADEPALQMATLLYWEFKTNYADFTAAKMARLENLLGKFGMTPADRAKINVGGEKKTEKNDPLAEFTVN